MRLTANSTTSTGPERPIPSGAVGHDTVFRWGVGFLVVGTLMLLLLGRVAGTLGLLLVICIVIYNAVHRVLPLSPLFKSVCRFSLYVLGAAVADRGVTGWSIWCGAALASYVAGLTWFESWRDRPREANLWPTVLLAGPILLALLMDVDGFRETGLVLSAVLALWVARCLQPAFWGPERDLRKSTSGLVPGIVFVDWLATCPVALPGRIETAPRELSIAFLILFGLSLLLQQATQTR